MYWESDSTVPQVLAEQLGRHGIGGRLYVAVDSFYNFIAFDLLTRPLPGHLALTVIAPAVAYGAGILFVGLAARLVAGTGVALLVAALALAQSPNLMVTGVVQAHALTWANSALLGWALVRVATTGRPPLWAILPLGAFTGLNLASDPLLAITGLAPFILGGVATAIARRDDGQGRVLVAWVLLVVVAAALGALAAGAAARAAGFVILRPANGLLAPPSRWMPNLAVGGYSLVQVFSGRFGAPPGDSAALTAAALAVFLLALAMPAWLVARGWGGLRRQSPGRAAYRTFWGGSLALQVGAFIFSGFANGTTTWRYLGFAFYCVAALVALVPVSAPRLHAARLAVAAYAVAAAVGLATWAPAGARAVDRASLVELLRRNGLTSGFADYIDANSTTWASGMRLEVRPVLQGRDCLASDARAICPDHFYSSSDWYTPSLSRIPTFVIVDHGGDASVARPPSARLGVPAKVLAEGQWTVYVYDHDVAPAFLPGRSTAGS